MATGTVLASESGMIAGGNIRPGQLRERAPGTRKRLENTERIHLLPGSR
jgi:hypothetical protein